MTYAPINISNIVSIVVIYIPFCTRKSKERITCELQNLLMLFRELITGCSEESCHRRSKLYGQNVGIVKP